jgi:outer membrane protein assembly factor BamC
VNLQHHALAGGLALAGLIGLAACTSTEGFLAGDKVDYRSQSSKTPALEIPPDLTQLTRDSRYQPQSGVVSAHPSNSGRRCGPSGSSAASPWWWTIKPAA